LSAEVEALPGVSNNRAIDRSLSFSAMLRRAALAFLAALLVLLALHKP
jgi:hypothetical protein